MKYLLTFSLIFYIGCGTAEQSLTPDENEEHFGEMPTSIVKIAPLFAGRIQVTQWGVPTQTFVIVDGELTERIVFFKMDPKKVTITSSVSARLTVNR